jgi:hypothetical protein
VGGSSLDDVDCVVLLCVLHRDAGLCTWNDGLISQWHIDVTSVVPWAYKETPSCLQYSIEWKVVVNNKVVAKDTEQDLVLVSSAHWHLCLKLKVEKLLSKKVAHSRHVEFDDTSVVVSVNDRSQRDLTKQFNSIDVDWLVIERQLIQ